MFIRTLSLKNVGRYADVALAFPSPVAIILGLNASGKTTLARALEVLLCGDVHAFRGTKVGTGGLIGPHGDAAVIQATIARGEPKDVEVRRRISARGLTTSIGGKESTKAVFDYFAPASMIDPAGTFRVITNVSGFLDLDEAQQKALLLALVDRSVPKEALDGLPMEGRVSPPKTLDDLAEAYQRAYDARRDTKRTLDAIRVPPEPEMAEQATEAIRDKIETLRAQEKALIASQGQATGQRQALATRRDDLAEKVDRAGVRLQELGTLADAEARLRDAGEALAAIRAENAALDGALGERRGKQETLARVREWDRKLGGLGASCVIADNLPCPLTDKKREAVRAGWAKEIAALEAELAAPAPAPKSTTRAEQRVSEAQQIIAAIGRVTEEKQRADTELAEAKQKLAALPDAPAAADTLAEIRSRVGAGEANLTKAQQVNDAWRARKRAQAQREVLEVDVTALETLCAAFGPKGIGEWLLSERIGDVLLRLNRVLARFGLEIGVQSEPSWGLRFNGRAPVLLSGSERFRAGVALQVAIGAITGARWALVDGADVLDRANRGILFKLLSDAVERGFVEQAIVTATVANDDAFAIRWPAPFTAYRVSATETGSAIKALAEAVPA